jgi:hypothetical protein
VKKACQLELWTSNDESMTSSESREDGDSGITVEQASAFYCPPAIATKLTKFSQRVCVFYQFKYQNELKAREKIECDGCCHAANLWRDSNYNRQHIDTIKQRMCGVFEEETEQQECQIRVERVIEEAKQLLKAGNF